MGGGVEKRGGWKTSRMTPLPKRVLDPPPPPPSYGTFSTPSGVSALFFFFPVQKSTRQSKPEALLEGSKKSFGRARSLVRFPPPPYVLHPPIYHGPINIRKVTSTPDPDTLEKYRDTPLISMAYFCKSMPSSWQTVVYTPPICITIRLPFVSRYSFRSIRVRGRWNTPNLKGVVND